MIIPALAETIFSSIYLRYNYPLLGSRLAHFRSLSTNSAIARGIRNSRNSTRSAYRERPSLREKYSQRGSRRGQTEKRPIFREKFNNYDNPGAAPAPNLRGNYRQSIGSQGRFHGKFDTTRESNLASRNSIQREKASTRNFEQSVRVGYKALPEQTFTRDPVFKRGQSRSNSWSQVERGNRSREHDGFRFEEGDIEAKEAFQDRQRTTSARWAPGPARREREAGRRSSRVGMHNIGTKPSRSRPQRTEIPREIFEESMQQEANTPLSPIRDAPRTMRHFPEPMPYTSAASEFMFGARVASAALRAARRKFYKLYIDARKIQQPGTMAHMVYTLAQKASIETVKLSELEISRLDQISKGKPHDGVVLEVSPAPRLPIAYLGGKDDDQKTFRVEALPQSREDLEINGSADILKWNDDKWRNPCLLWLHGVVDIQNVGAILRSAFFYSIDAVILTSRATAPLNLGVSRSSAGASEHVQVLTIEDPASFMTESSKNGWRFHATVAQPVNSNKLIGPPGKRMKTRFITDLEPDKHPLKASPVVLVLGNEDFGLPTWLQRQAHFRWSIGGGANAPKWDVDSLNVSVAGAIFLDRFLQKPADS